MTDLVPCLYCERRFSDHAAVHDHMRAQHPRLYARSESYALSEEDEQRAKMRAYHEAKMRGLA